MKKYSVLISLLAVFALVLAACAPAAEEAAPAAEEEAMEEEVMEEEAEEEVMEEETYTIGYGAPELSGGQGQIRQGLLDYAAEKGWEVVDVNADQDAETQANQMENFIAQGVDAIVTVPVDSQAICASVTKAKDAGIPFFTIDRAPIGCEIDMVVQSDNYLAGKQAAEEMVELLTEKYGEPTGTVLELQGDLGQNVAQLRGGGFNDYMADYPNITVISKPTEWLADKFAAATTDVVGSQDVDGIYMHSDCVGTTVVLAALEQLGKKFTRDEEGHIFLTGVDGCAEAIQAIKDGYSDEASSQPIPDFGIITNWMEMVFNGEAIEEGTVEQEGALWSPATIVKSDVGFMLNLATTKVTPDNADNPALWGNN